MDDLRFLINDFGTRKTRKRGMNTDFWDGNFELGFWKDDVVNPLTGNGCRGGVVIIY